jgi:hypothetical protein
MAEIDLTTDADVAAAEARLSALAHWRELHEPLEVKPVVLSEAAARAPLMVTEDGPAFDPATFRDLLEFIAEMPF